MPDEEGRPAYVFITGFSIGGAITIVTFALFFYFGCKRYRQQRRIQIQEKIKQEVMEAMTHKKELQQKQSQEENVSTSTNQKTVNEHSKTGVNRFRNKSGRINKSSLMTIREGKEGPKRSPRPNTGSTQTKRNGVAPVSVQTLAKRAKSPTTAVS